MELSLDIYIKFKRSSVDGYHQTNATIAGIPIDGDGNFNVIFHNAGVGATIKFNINNDATLAIKSLNITQIHLGSVTSNLRGFGFFIDPIINEAVEIRLPSASLKDETERVGELLLAKLLGEPANRVLNRTKVQDVFVAILDFIKRSDRESKQT